MRKYKEYAIYKGDKFLYMGTAKECAKYFNVKEKTIFFLANKTYRKRIEERRKSRNAMIAIVVEEE